MGSRLPTLRAFVRETGQFRIVQSSDSPASVPDGSAFLVPVGASTKGTTKLVPKEIASAIASWRQREVEVTAQLLERFGECPLQLLGALVYDCVLEVSFDQIRWASGPIVAGVVSRHPHEPDMSGNVENFGMSLVRLRLHPRPQADGRRLAKALYVDGRVPFTDFQQHSDAVEWYGLDDVLRASLRQWTPARRSHSDAWWIWRLRRPIRRRQGARWKMYVASAPAWLPVALHKALPILADAGADAFKVPSLVRESHRPDKFVVYFSAFSQVRAAAAEVDRALQDVPVQEVPFTCMLSDSGRVSWGVDPPGEVTLPWADDRSWRWWVCCRLAGAMIKLPLGVPVQDALMAVFGRVAADGLDPHQWRPSEALLHEWYGKGAGV